MNAKNAIGIILVVLGAISLAYNGISYTRRRTVLEIGSLKATADQKQTIPIPPAVGLVVLVGGLAVLVLGRGNEGV